MKTIATALVVLLAPGSVFALFECWDEQTPSSLAAGSEFVALGFVESVRSIGCKFADGRIRDCPQPVPGQLYPDVVFQVRFEVHRVLKGDPQEVVEFFLVTPPLLVGCEGPGTKQGVETLTFLKREADHLTAWGGDYALYQDARWDFAKVLAEVVESLRGEASRTQNTSGEPLAN